MATPTFPAGVLTGDDVLRLFQYAKDAGFAIPAFNVSSSSTVNAVLEAAAKTKNPIVVQVSEGGAKFFAGAGLKGDKKTMSNTVAGSVAAALFVRSMAKHYGVPVVMHSDHCAKKLLPWFDGMLKADEEYFAAFGEPLFSSHMLDLSEEVDEENIGTCAEYFKRMAPMGLWLEMEIGITGGVEDGVDNSEVDNDKLYTSKEQVHSVYQALAPIGPMFSIAAAFGNVHGTYKSDSVHLRPELLAEHQAFTKEQLSSEEDKPLFLVFHGGSGSSADDVATAVGHGVVKMNIDTDTQWAYWSGTRDFIKKNQERIWDCTEQSMVDENGELAHDDKGKEMPNKGFYDPRKWVRAGEVAMVARVEQAFSELNATETLGADYDPPAYEGAIWEAPKAEPSSGPGGCQVM